MVHARVEKALQIAAIQQESVEVHSTQLEQPIVKAQVVHADNLDAQIESQLVQTVPHHMDKSGTTFHMSLHNVFDEIVKPQSPVHDVQPILTLASDFMPIFRR